MYTMLENMPNDVTHMSRVCRNTMNYARLTSAKIRAVVTSGEGGREMVFGGFKSSSYFLSLMNQSWQNLTRVRGCSTCNSVFSEYLKYFMINIQKVSTVNMSMRTLSLSSVHSYGYENTDNKIIL